MPRPQGPYVCPKCGSHRTQIIGITDDPNRVKLRCGACGAISTVSKHDAAPAA
jgi:transcription elongation factor Elf1